MLYSQAQHLAFVHVHKTGGVSLRELLVKRIDGMRELPELPGAHHSVQELFTVLAGRGVGTDDVRVLTVLRNPWAHALSVWTFWRSDAITAAERTLPTVAFARAHSFRDFLLTVLVHDQYAPALLVDGRLPENVHVLRLETLADDATRVLRDELGLLKRVRLRRRNESRHGPYREYYDDELRAHVRRTYAWCFDAGYYRDDDW